MNEFHFKQFSMSGQLVCSDRVTFEGLSSSSFEKMLIDGFTRLLMQSPNPLKTVLPFLSPEGVPFEFQPDSPSTGVVFVGKNEPTLMAYGILASGLDAAADSEILKGFQDVIVKTLRNTASEPAFDLSNEKDRPLLAITRQFAAERSQEAHLYQAFIGSFAAAFFRMRGVI